MQNNDINRDDFLGKLIQQIELDCPSNSFVDNVMSKCCTEQVVIQSRFRLVLPWVIASIVFIGLFTLTFLFGGGLIGGSIYSLFSGSSVLLKVLATMKLGYVGLTFGTLGGILLIINQIKQQRLILKVV